jgi:Protein of unknown function (DUF2924)
MARNTSANRSARSADRAENLELSSEAGNSTRHRQFPDLAEEIVRLGDVTREVLIQTWIRTHGRPPPKSVSRRLLELSAAYALQAKVFGGLKPHLRKALAAALDPNLRSANPKARVMTLRPGSQLVRVWNGRTHYVEVVEGGFIWNDQQFRSLTAIAYRITGARWSGPRFFGL